MPINYKKLTSKGQHSDPIPRRSREMNAGNSLVFLTLIEEEASAADQRCAGSIPWVTTTMERALVTVVPKIQATIGCEHYRRVRLMAENLEKYFVIFK